MCAYTCMRTRGKASWIRGQNNARDSCCKISAKNCWFNWSMNTCAPVCTRRCTCAYTYVCVHECLCVRMYVRVCVLVYVPVCVYVYVPMRTYLCVRVCLCVCVPMRTYLCVRVYVCLQTCIRDHIGDHTCGPADMRMSQRLRLKVYSITRQHFFEMLIDVRGSTSAALLVLSCFPDAY